MSELDHGSVARVRCTRRMAANAPATTTGAQPGFHTATHGSAARRAAWYHPATKAHGIFTG